MLGRMILVWAMVLSAAAVAAEVDSLSVMALQIRADSPAEIMNAGIQ